MTRTISTRPIGRTKLHVTDISFGAAPLGNLYRAVTDADSHAVLDTAWQGGIRFFDTAPYYGHGLSERRIGDFLRTKPSTDWVLATKVGRRLEPVAQHAIPDHGFEHPLPFRPVFDYSYDGIMRSIEHSYARLGLNRIDIAWIHDIGVLTHGADANRAHFEALFSSGLRALEELKASGAIGAYGLGVNEVPVRLAVTERAPRDATLLAGRYSLLDRSATDTLIPLCERTHTSLVIGGVFNSGILATGPVSGAHFDYAPASDHVLASVRAMSDIAERHDIPLAAAALRFPLQHPTVASVLIGTAKSSSLARNLALLDLDIPDAIWPELEPHTVRQAAHP